MRLKVSKSGMLQEYAQFSADSLGKIVDRTVKAKDLLSDYWEWRSDASQTVRWLGDDV